MTVHDITDFIQAGLPDAREKNFQVLDIDADGHLWCRLPHHPQQLRPGGTLSGPTLMTLADAAMYACVLHNYGPVAMAVTQSLSIQFLRKPPLADLDARAEKLHSGGRSMTMEVRIYSTGTQELVALATGVYALPAVTK